MKRIHGKPAKGGSRVNHGKPGTKHKPPRKIPARKLRLGFELLKP